MSKLFFTIGEKEIEMPKILIVNRFEWLSKLFGIDTDFEEKNKLETDLLYYFPKNCDYGIILLIQDINDWFYDREKFYNILDSFNGRQAMNFLKHGPSKLENIKKWQCTKCLEITYNIKEDYIQHKLNFFGSNDCAAICINCGIRWSSWYNLLENNVVYCKKIQTTTCQHNWEEN